MRSAKALSKILGNIKVLALDVDGTLTDGGIYLSGSSFSMKKFHVHDGLGIRRVQNHGIRVVLMSNSNDRDNIERRARTMGISKYVFTGDGSKREILAGWVSQLEVEPQRVAYIGDDLNDLEVMAYVGVSACPSNAVERVRSEADIVLGLKGGEGCVREFIDVHLKISL